MLLLTAGADLVDLSARLLNLGFVLDGDPIPLGATSGPCSGQLAEIDVGGTPLGQALEQLEALEQESPGVDPCSSIPNPTTTSIRSITWPR